MVQNEIQKGSIVKFPLNKKETLLGLVIACYDNGGIRIKTNERGVNYVRPAEDLLKIGEILSFRSDLDRAVNRAVKLLNAEQGMEILRSNTVYNGIGIGSIVKHVPFSEHSDLGIVTDIVKHLGYFYWVIEGAGGQGDIWYWMHNSFPSIKPITRVSHADQEYLLKAVKEGMGPEVFDTYMTNAIIKGSKEPLLSQVHPSEVNWNSIESTKSRGFPVWDGVPEPVVSKSFKEPLKEIDPKDCCTGSDIGNVKDYKSSKNAF